MVISAGDVYNLILHHFIHIPLIDGEVEPSLGEYRSAHDIDMLIMGGIWPLGDPLFLCGKHHHRNP